MRKPKPDIKSEWFIKQQVKRILDDTGWIYWMPSANAFGRSGQSDFLAVKSTMLFMAIETKYRDVVTALQFKFLSDIHEAGHYAFLVDETNIDELRDVLTPTIDAISGEVTIVSADFGSFMKWKEQLPEKT
jgi:hypothetical protein